MLGWRLRKSSVATSRRRHRCRRAAGQRQRALAAAPGLQGAPTSTAARSCRASQHPVSFLRTVVWRHPDRVLGASGRPPVRAQRIPRHPVCCVIGSGPLAEHVPFARAHAKTAEEQAVAAHQPLPQMQNDNAPLPVLVSRPARSCKSSTTAALIRFLLLDAAASEPCVFRVAFKRSASLTGLIFAHSQPEPGVFCFEIACHAVVPVTPASTRTPPLEHDLDTRSPSPHTAGSPGRISRSLTKSLGLRNHYRCSPPATSPLTNHCPAPANSCGSALRQGVHHCSLGTIASWHPSTCVTTAGQSATSAALSPSLYLGAFSTRHLHFRPQRISTC